MNESPLKISAIQMVSGTCFQQNLKQAIDLIKAAVADDAKMVVLPEYFALMGLAETDKFKFVESHSNGLMQLTLSQLAKELNVWIVAGTHPIHSDEEMRPYGRCYVFNHLGETVTWYDKIHLFDVSVEDNQGSYCESKYSKAGDTATSFDTPWGKIGLAVCYDLRFPELFRKLTSDGCTILIMSAAFTFKTGQVHWDVLIKARAIENLCYFVASAQGGQHENGRETWGHSCIIDPWGKVLASITSGKGFVSATLDFNEQATLRKEFPVLTHKKL
jgi:predicted amidohydrolase